MSLQLNDPPKTVHRSTKNPDEYSSEGFDGMSKEKYSDMKILVNSIYLLVNSDGDVNGIVDGTQSHYPFQP